MKVTLNSVAAAKAVLALHKEVHSVFDALQLMNRSQRRNLASNAPRTWKWRQRSEMYVLAVAFLLTCRLPVGKSKAILRSKRYTLSAWIVSHLSLVTKKCQSSKQRRPSRLYAPSVVGLCSRLGERDLRDWPARLQGGGRVEFLWKLWNYCVVQALLRFRVILYIRLIARRYLRCSVKYAIIYFQSSESADRAVAEMEKNPVFSMPCFVAMRDTYN